MDQTDNDLYFPRELILRLAEGETDAPAQNVVVTLRLFARKKNDYDLGPPLSNQEGVIVIIREWAQHAVDYYRNAYIMDYSTTMERCLPRVRIKVLSGEEISRAARAMKLYGAENGGPEIAYSVTDLANATNELYEPQEIYVDLGMPEVSTKEIQIRLRRVE